MMETVFFPFSHVSNDQCRTLLAFFPNFSCLPLETDFSSDPDMAALAEKGRIKPWFASPGDLGAVEAGVKAYMEWAGLHRGNERNLKALLKDNPYFTDDSGQASITSQLQQQIRGGEAARSREAAPADPLLFLKFAQMADSQNEKIDRELMGLEKSRAALFSSLKGEIGPAVPDASPMAPADPGQTMTRERIACWARYADRKGLFRDAVDSTLLVTTSEAVFDHLESISHEPTNALDIDTIKVHEDGCEFKPEWQQSLMETLMATLKSGQTGQGQGKINLPGTDDGCCLSGQLRMCLFTGKAIKKLFGVPGGQIAVCLVKIKA